MIFDTKAIFVHSAGRKKVIYLGTKGPAEDRAGTDFWERYLKSLGLRRYTEAEDILLKPLLFSLGYHAFANHTAEGCPSFPSVKCVRLVNPQLFLTLSQGLVRSLADGAAAACSLCLQDTFLYPLTSRLQRGRIFHPDVITRLSEF